MTETQKQFVEKPDLDKLKALEAKMDALKATEFTGSVNQLPTVSEIENADADTLMKYNAQFADTKKLYEALTDSQKGKVAESTTKQYDVIKDALKKASDKLNIKPEGDDSDDADGTQSQVSDLLQKILEELQAQNKNDSAGN